MTLSKDRVWYNISGCTIDFQISETLDTQRHILSDLRFPWYSYCPKVEGESLVDDGNHCYDGGTQFREAIERAEWFLHSDRNDGRVFNLRVHFVKTQYLHETRWRVFDSNIDMSGHFEDGFYLSPSTSCLLDFPYTMDVGLLVNGCVHIVTWKGKLAHTPPLTYTHLADPQMLLPIRGALHLVCDEAEISTLATG
jgi:hypothetical protein